MTTVAATQDRPPEETTPQYSLAKILGIWAAAAIPMAILGWIVAPALAPDITSDPIGAAVTRVGLLTVGLIWQFILSMIIVYREEGDLRWATVRRRLWLNTPRDPKTGEPRARLWLWLVPLLILFALIVFALGPTVDGLWVSLFPFFAEPPAFSFGTAMGLPEVQAQLVAIGRS